MDAVHNPFAPGAGNQMLGLKTTSVGPTRGKLIKKGMIHAPAHA